VNLGKDLPSSSLLGRETVPEVMLCSLDHLLFVQVTSPEVEVSHEKCPRNRLDRGQGLHQGFL
jgi:hypothetical protein